MQLINYSESNGSVIFTVRVIPRSSKTEIVGEHDGAVKIKLRSPPVDGAANEELIRFLAKALSVPRSSLEIVSGHTSRTKRVSVTRTTTVHLSAILRAKI